MKEIEEGNSKLERKLEDNNKLERKLEDNRLETKKTIEDKKFDKKQQTNVGKIRRQIEETIRKKEESKVLCSPITRRKQAREQKRKLEDSMKKIGQSSKLKGRSIDDRQRSIWEFWGNRDRKPDTHS